MQVLFEVTTETTQNSTQSHMKYTFFVPEQAEKLHIYFDYEPACLEDESLAEQIIEQSFTYYGLMETEQSPVNKVNKHFPIKNLLTISVDDPDGFRGARHCHLPSQQISISERDASPGMLNKAMPSGLWSVTVSAHAIVTEKCKYFLRVTAEGVEQDPGSTVCIPWQHRPLTADIPINDRGSVISKRETKNCSYWVPSELHSHTYHSDGQQSVQEIADTAEMLGLEVVAVTDHNTTSPLQEMTDVSEKTNVTLLYGLEWTTFYGHLLTFGYKQLTYTDWRTIGPQDIIKGIQEIHKHGAIAGLAHPFRVGNPLGTGCHWEFVFDRIDDFDFIEVWNGARPGSSYYNQKAFAFWTELLNKGYRLPATAGRDWHHNNDKSPLPAIAYVHMPDDMPRETDQFRETFLQSIRDGALTISYGPPVILEAEVDRQTYSIGNIIESKKELISIQVHSEEWKDWKQETFQLQLSSNLGKLKAAEKGKVDLSCQLESDSLTWIRAELFAGIEGNEEMIAFTNPIYFI